MLPHMCSEIYINDVLFRLPVDFYVNICTQYLRLPNKKILIFWFIYPLQSEENRNGYVTLTDVYAHVN